MKFDKPLEEEIDWLLNEIPNATSVPPIHHHHHAHHHQPIGIPMPHPHAHRHPSYFTNSPYMSDGSSSSSSSPHSPAHLDFIAAFHSLSLRKHPPPQNPLHPLRRYSTQPLYHRAHLAPARPALYNFHDDASLVLDGRSSAAAAWPAAVSSKKRVESSVERLEALAEVPEYIYQIAKDQHGCRLLQRKFEEGRRQDVDRIFDGVIGHVADLMMNPFGNYLVQKLLDVCTEEQRMMIVIRLTRDPSVIIRVSLNTHGTRAVQKLIETLKTQQQLRLVVSALKPSLLNLIKDLNGNHVVQRCLQYLSAKDNTFIFDAAAKHCVDIATHRHGCVVLQRCIAYSSGEYLTHMVNEVSANGLLLAQDAFGNYVVQFILDLRNPSITACLASQFYGNYVHLSTQKFSSNVVEKCLKVFSADCQARIVFELLSVSRFEMLLQDPFANYVIQSALAHTKGRPRDDLVQAIQTHDEVLRTSPYSKRILSRTHLRK